MKSLFLRSNEPRSSLLDFGDCRKSQIFRRRNIWPEQMGGTYTLGEDGVYYPDLVLPEEEKAHYGKYGILRRTYLKEYRKALYFDLLINGKLVAHLNEIDDAANARMELLTRQMQEKQGISEGLKSQNQMAWGERVPVALVLRTDRAGGETGAMNNIRNAAEEIVLRELIYD